MQIRDGISIPPLPEGDEYLIKFRNAHGGPPRQIRISRATDRYSAVIRAKASAGVGGGWIVDEVVEVGEKLPRATPDAPPRTVPRLVWSREA
jgi:hypothetical protein